MKHLVVISAFLLIGCGTMQTGIVQIEPNLFMVGGLGNATDFSGSVVKARFYQQAAAFCSTKQKTLNVISSAHRDSAPAVYASAEIHFSCK